MPLQIYVFHPEVRPQTPLEKFFFPQLSFIPVVTVSKVSSPLPKTPPLTPCLLSAKELASYLTEKIKT